MKDKQKMKELEEELKQLFCDDDSWNHHVEQTEREIGIMSRPKCLFLMLKTTLLFDSPGV